MALTDTRTIAIGVVIGLLVGGGIGYLIPQSKINELHTQNLDLMEDYEEIYSDIYSLTSVLRDAEEAFESQKETIDNQKVEFEELESKLADVTEDSFVYKNQYQEMWIAYSALIQDYNVLSSTPVGQMTATEVSGVLNGDFESEGDWVKQGKGGIGWGEAQLHQYESFSTFLSQNLYLDSIDQGIKFDVKPNPLGGTVGLQVSIGDIKVYDTTFTGPNSNFDFDSVVIPLKVLLEMREHYELPVEGYYALKFTIPAGPESGALVIIDNVSLVNLLYLPEQPLG